MDDGISEDQLPLWPVFEVSKFKCPCCDHVLTLSLSQVAWLLHEEWRLQELSATRLLN